MQNYILFFLLSGLSSSLLSCHKGAMTGTLNGRAIGGGYPLRKSELIDFTPYHEESKEVADKVQTAQSSSYPVDDPVRELKDKFALVASMRLQGRDQNGK